ncbi:MAG: SPOR domain-containing protein [Ignavibacteria bacterium]
MRIAFFLLVLVNLLFFVWSAGYLGGQDEGREPQRLQNQLNPEKMKVTLAPATAAAAPAPASPVAATGTAPSGAATPAVAAAPAPANAAPPAPAATPAVAAAPAQACRRITGVATKDGNAFQQSLQKAGFAVAVLPIEERSYWVNIPSLPTKAAAEKKAGELKALGVTDFHVIQGESGGFLISLGVRGDEASASQFLQGLMKKGVKSARIETRAKTPTTLHLELRAPADLLAQRLPALLPGAPGASLAECP